MGDDLRAAAMSPAELRGIAERLTARVLGEMTRPECQQARAVLDAYLAEHKADDAEPVTEEWLRSIGFKEVHGPIIVALAIGDPTETLPQTVECCPTTGSWHYGCCGLVPPQTRGQVRRLLAALGVQATA